MLYDFSSFVRSIVECSFKYIDTEVIIYNSCLREKKIISKQFEEKNLGDRLIALDAHSLKYSQYCSDFSYDLCCRYFLNDILNNLCTENKKVENSVIIEKFYKLLPALMKLLQEGHIEIYADNNDGEGFSVSESDISDLIDEKVDFETFSKDLLDSFGAYYTSLPTSLSITEKTEKSISQFVEKLLPEFDLKSIWLKGFEEISNFYLNIYSTSLNAATKSAGKVNNEPARHGLSLSEFFEESSKTYQELFEYRSSQFIRTTEATLMEFIDLEIDFFEKCQYDLENHESSSDGFSKLGINTFKTLNTIVSEVGYDVFYFSTKRKVEFLILQKEKIKEEASSDLDFLFGPEPEGIVKPFKKKKSKKKKESLQDIPPKSFFKKIRNGKLTQLEIHNKTEKLTDAFQLDKLEILLKDFEFYLFVEKEDHESSYSKLDIQIAIDALNKKGKEIPTNSIRDFQKDEDDKIKLIETGKRILNKESLLYPFEFFYCYQFQAYLKDEIEKHNNLSKSFGQKLNKDTEKKSILSKEKIDQLIGPALSPEVGKEVRKLTEGLARFYSDNADCDGVSKEDSLKVNQNHSNLPNTNTSSQLTFKDIFIVDDWRELIAVFTKLQPPLLDDSFCYIGPIRGKKGLICNWILTLQKKGKIKSSVNRQLLSQVLNNEIKGLNLGKDGSTFSKFNKDYINNWEEKLLNLAGLLP